jgi:hypothetical protein
MIVDWLEHRSPPAPDGLRKRMVRELGGAGGREAVGVEGPATALGAAAMAALTRAMSVGGADRDVAMDLLAADGLLTYACEAAAEEEDPGLAIDAILSHFRDPAGP